MDIWDDIPDATARAIAHKSGPGPTYSSHMDVEGLIWLRRRAQAGSSSRLSLFTLLQNLCCFSGAGGQAGIILGKRENRVTGVSNSRISIQCSLHFDMR
ncbi:hypothetical protein PoB_002223100 [Plakobranchus ocellatus]|uniref:Uncharacterized protein n=1 Tax=Plakobranchus ocellatus TaxID=259542 RepID=A0AAV3ZMI2_9GAST|nr:hypothetical protein PoB_002223100 [Plakobranchus ocellatus]